MATEIVLSSVVLHICACLTFPSGSTSNDVPVVYTDLGAIAGRKLTVSGEEVDAFYGIPYAEPPVGNLRFKKSLPAKPWKEVLSATKKPKPCWQFDFPFGVNITLHYENTSIASEDCLYLSIWRPSSVCPSTGTCIANLPVVVFLYGGAFQWGDSALFLYDPANFVALSNVVYVTLNYRLGVLGFLSSGTETLPGNYGLWDQNLALKWVQRNVGRFGGNPNDVTLNGFSAGAISAGLQAISPHSRGLFHKLILQSSTPLSMILGISLAGVGKFLGVAGNLGCFDGDPDWSENVQKIMRCLEMSNVDYIYNTLSKAGGVSKIFSPVYGDEFLPYNFSLADAWQSLTSKHIFLGTNSNEGSYFIYFMKYFAPQLTQLTKIDLRLAVSFFLSTLLEIPLTTAKTIANTYFGDSSVEHNKTSLFNIAMNMFGDMTVDCPTNVFSEVAANQGIKLYRYIFAHRPSFSGWPENYGVTHMDDLAFTLGSLPFINDSARFTSPFDSNAQKRLKAAMYTPAELSFMKEIVATWASFIRNGKPSIPLSSEEWPEYSTSKHEGIYLQPQNYTRGQPPRLQECELWRPILLKGNLMEQVTTGTAKEFQPTKMPDCVKDPCKIEHFTQMNASTRPKVSCIYPVILAIITTCCI
ncbi:unnamed protein product [Ixodes persulcatus]